MLEECAHVHHTLNLELIISLMDAELVHEDICGQTDLGPLFGGSGPEASMVSASEGLWSQGVLWGPVSAFCGLIGALGGGLND